jgi:hypothetical protein
VRRRILVVGNSKAYGSNVELVKLRSFQSKVTCRMRWRSGSGVASATTPRRQILGSISANVY